jgi:endonuclease/exonuclease/phosphatase family metal-dependent hydrolase
VNASHAARRSGYEQPGVIVATWNLENLYLPGGEFGPHDQPAYDAKLDALAATIEAIGPDVLAVQEVGDPAALDELTGRIGGTWHVALSEQPDDRGIRVGFLSRAAIERVDAFRRFPDGLAPVQVEDDGTTARELGRGGLGIRVGGVELVTCHLKSKLLSFPGGRFNPRNEGERARYGAYALYLRAAEVVTLRAHADALLDGAGAERATVLLGDLNDELQAATTQVLLGPPGSEIGTPGFDHPDQGDARRLWNLAPLIPPERRFTRVYRGRRELIDHVLVSRAVVDRVTRVDTATDELPSITEEPAARRDTPGSDHAPVIVELSD